MRRDHDAVVAQRGVGIVHELHAALGEPAHSSPQPPQDTDMLISASCVCTPSSANSRSNVGYVAELWTMKPLSTASVGPVSPREVSPSAPKPSSPPSMTSWVWEWPPR